MGSEGTPKRLPGTSAISREADDEIAVLFFSIFFHLSDRLHLRTRLERHNLAVRETGVFRIRGSPLKAPLKRPNMIVL